MALPAIADAATQIAGAAAYFAGTAQDNGFTYRTTNFAKINPAYRRQLVQYYSPEPLGSVVVDTQNHFLYVIFENNTALRYGVGVGREGFRWYGKAQIDRKALWPRWVPPPEMRKRQPELPLPWTAARTIRSARAPCICTAAAAISATAFTARWSPGDRHERFLGLRPHVPRGYHRPLPALPASATRVLVLKHLGAPIINEAAPGVAPG